MTSNRIITSVLVCLMLLIAVGQAQASIGGQRVYIWQGTQLGKQDVYYTLYRPSRPTGVGIVVCPGGSYFWLDMHTEGAQVAQALNERGITAVVLKYRVAGKSAFVTHYRVAGGGNHHPYMIQDLQRTIQLVRENATSYGIDAHKIGVMGFSAGGHQALMSAVNATTNFMEPLGLRPAVSLAPDFVAAIYPVVSMSSQWTHGRSRRGLMSEKWQNDPVLRDSLSMEKHVPAGCPPVFVVNCKDDPIVNYHNAELLDSALTANHVPHRYIQYATGGHGFGASQTKGTAECRQWKDEFIRWFREISR